MTRTIAKHTAEFNIFDILDIVSEYAVPRPTLDEAGHDFINNLDRVTDNPSRNMVIGFLNRHLFIKDNVEHTLRLAFAVTEDKYKNNPTRPFVLTHKSMVTDLIKWAKRAGNRRLTRQQIISEMEETYGDQIAKEAQRDHHNVESLVGIIEEGRIMNFNNLCRYVSVVAPNTKLEILAMKDVGLRYPVASDDLRVEWNLYFNGGVTVTHDGKREVFEFADDEETETTPAPAPKAAPKADKFSNLTRLGESIVTTWIDLGLLDQNMETTKKFWDTLIAGDIEYTGAE